MLSRASATDGQAQLLPYPLSGFTRARIPESLGRRRANRKQAQSAIDTSGSGGGPAATAILLVCQRMKRSTRPSCSKSLSERGLKVFASDCGSAGMLASTKATTSSSSQPSCKRVRATSRSFYARSSSGSEIRMSGSFVFISTLARTCWRPVSGSGSQRPPRRRTSDTRDSMLVWRIQPSRKGPRRGAGSGELRAGHPSSLP
jgi:hypothetical protein